MEQKNVAVGLGCSSLKLPADPKSTQINNITTYTGIIALLSDSLLRST